MSRASDLRDELVTELSTRFPTTTIETFVIPDWEREELNSTPRLGVRFADREVDSIEDQRTVTIEIGVIALIEFSDGDETGQTKADLRAKQVEISDACDGVVEDVIALWTPKGPLFRVGFADHRFHELKQVRGFDPKQLYDNGVWLSVIQVHFKDIEDE